MPRDRRGLSRRRLLTGSLGAAALTLRTPSTAAQERPESASRPGRGPNELGARAEAERPRRLPSPTSSRTPLQDLHGTITPSDVHFERHHAGVPVIDKAAHRLLVHGMVERPLAFTVDELTRLPSTSRICFLECSGNFVRQNGERTTPQALCGLTSQSEWTGVKLSTLLAETGISARATWFLAEGQDAALMTRSIPLREALPEALIVYAQNGEALRPEQGYPIRLFLPGWEGNASVKWLRRLELADQPFMTREETSKYTEPFANDTARMFSLVMDARSLITHPAFPTKLERGWVDINGIAWTGSGRITRVDISTDGGKTWTPARLQEPVLPKAHTRFHHLWQWTGGEAVIMSRAVDETGYMQPTRAELFKLRGPGTTGYHLNPITGWVVRADGTVVYKEEPWG